MDPLELVEEIEDERRVIVRRLRLVAGRQQREHAAEPGHALCAMLTPRRADASRRVCVDGSR